MVIERDRYLDDSGDWLLSLALRSRSPGTHSLLSALDGIARLLAEKRARGAEA